MSTCVQSVYAPTTVQGELINAASGTDREGWLCISSYARQLGVNSVVET